MTTNLVSGMFSTNPAVTRPWVRRLAVTAGAAAAAVLAAPGIALAHVTVQPGSVEGGGFTVVSFRVPTERDNASTTKIRVLFPEDQPVGSVRTTPVPGWKITTETRTLDEPIEMFGEEVPEVVSEVTWTATSGGIAPGQFQDFDVSLGPLPESGEMVFQALQTYSNGELVKWNEVAVDDTVELEHPAPVLSITAPAAENTTTDPAAQATTDSADGPESSSGTATEAASGGESSPTLPVVLSGAALLVSLAALILTWRRRTT